MFSNHFEVIDVENNVAVISRSDCRRLSVCRPTTGLGASLTSILQGLALKASQAKYTSLIGRLLPAISALVTITLAGPATDNLAEMFTAGAHPLPMQRCPVAPQLFLLNRIRHPSHNVR